MVAGMCSQHSGLESRMEPALTMVGTIISQGSSSSDLPATAHLQVGTTAICWGPRIQHMSL